MRDLSAASRISGTRAPRITISGTGSTLRGSWMQHMTYQLYSVVFEPAIRAIVRSLGRHRQSVHACPAGHMNGVRGRIGAGHASQY